MGKTTQLFKGIFDDRDFLNKMLGNRVDGSSGRIKHQIVLS